jgi:hypothetical protein
MPSLTPSAVPEGPGGPGDPDGDDDPPAHGPPHGDDPDHNDGPHGPEEPEDNQRNLADALNTLTNSMCQPSESSSRTKIREPDTFDGSNSCKLCIFLLQCTLNFKDRP